jgi:VWFA-related protein
MHRIAIVTGVALAALAVHVTAQQPAQAPAAQPTFRLGVNFVEVDTVVTDGDGRFVRDLTAEDFEIYENGVPQKVSVFSLVDIPVERDDPVLGRPAVQSDVLSNADGGAGRVYFLVLDDLHVSAHRTQIVRDIANRFVDRYVGANDLAAVIHVSKSNLNQPFTFSKPLLRRSINRFTGRKLPSRTLNKLADATMQQELADLPGNLMGPLVDADAPVRLHFANQMLGTIEDLARYVSRLQGRRKAFVLFSEGIDYDLEAPLVDSFSGLAIGTEVSSIHGALRAMLETAMRANVTIYPVDPRGLGHELEGVSALGLIPTGYAFPEGVDPLPSYGIRDVQRGLRDELDGALDALRTLAHETGGFAAINSNDFERPFRRIVDDNSSYYLLGYYPSNDANDGSFRNVRVRVRQPGLEVVARRGYFARRVTDADPPTRESAVAAVREVASSPAGSSGLAMRVVPQILKAPSGVARVHLTVELDPDQVPFRQDPDGFFTNDLLVLWQMTDADGEVRASTTRRATFRLRPTAHAQAQEFGVNMIAEFDVPAGRYELRVAVLEELSGRSGSVAGTLEVPRFQTSTLEMSSLVLAAPTSKFEFAASDGAGALERLLPAPPTSRRAFGADEQLAVYAEIYDNDRRPHTVDLALRVTDEDGRQVFVVEDQRDQRELAGRSYGHLVALPLDRFRPGRYVLSVEARSRLGTEVKRETTITVK